MTFRYKTASAAFDVRDHVVFRYPSRLACFFLAVIVSLNFGAIAQTATAPAKSQSRLALRRGQEALKSGDIVRARTEFEQAVRLAPNDAEAQSALGWVLAQQGETDAAVAHLRAAIKAKPGFVEARLTLIGVLSQQGKAAEAEEEARAAVKLAPDNAEAHRMLARILSQHPGEELCQRCGARCNSLPNAPTCRMTSAIFWRSGISLPKRKPRSKKHCAYNRILSRRTFIWA